MPKVKLTRRYLYMGRTYGPGTVEIEDAAIAAYFEGREQRAADAKAEAKAAPKPTKTDTADAAR